MFDIDKSLNKLLKGKPNKRLVVSKSLPKRMSRKKDYDSDGVVNKLDCQPQNTMRQDKLGHGFVNLHIDKASKREKERMRKQGIEVYAKWMANTNPNEPVNWDKLPPKVKSYWIKNAEQGLGFR